jgi:hypothetical protein
MTNPEAERVSAAQIAELLAWARSLSEAGTRAGPAQRAAYQAAKTALLARLTHQPGTNISPQGTVCD